MPYKPLQYRPVPTEAEPMARSVPPATAHDVNVTEFSPAIVTPPIDKKPTVRREARPRARRLDPEPAVNMGNWQVDPDRLIEDMGLRF